MFACSDERCDLTEHRQVTALRASKRKHLEEWEDPPLEVADLRDFEVPDAIWTRPGRPNLESRSEQRWQFRSYLRDVERQTDTPGKATITLSTDRDVEASLSVDESRDVVT